MSITRIIVLGAISLSVTACGELGPTPSDKSIDRGWDRHSLSDMQAGIWVDSNGCDHWIIDDGVEGYMSPRLTPDGRPVCSGVAEPNHVTGPFQRGSEVPDPL